MNNGLVIQNLQTSIDGKKILKGLNLNVKKGEVHIIMGPNGSGKSTLSYTVMGSPKYAVDAGTVTVDGEDLLSLPPDQRAKKGLFLGLSILLSNSERMIFFVSSLLCSASRLPSICFLIFLFFCSSWVSSSIP